MTDKIIGAGIIGMVGVIFLALGYLIWKKERITLFHDYHVENVSPEDKHAFCALSGIGISLMGVSLMITAAVFAVTASVLSFLVFAAGFVTGLILLITAGIKYNRRH